MFGFLKNRKLWHCVIDDIPPSTKKHDVESSNSITIFEE